MATGYKDIIKTTEANLKPFKEYEKREYPQELWPALREDGDSVRVRFLEGSEEFVGSMMHFLPSKTGGFGLKIPCLDQDGVDPNSCPGCVAGVPKSFKGFINVIWYDAPIYQRDENNRMVKDDTGTYKQIDTGNINAIWVQGLNVFKNLHQLDVAFGGLTGRDFTITRNGKGKQTTYMLVPAGEASKADQTLVDSKYKLDRLVEPRDYEYMVNQFLPSQTEVAGEVNATPFNRKNKFAR